MRKHFRVNVHDYLVPIPTGGVGGIRGQRDPGHRHQGVGVAIGNPQGGSGATYTNVFGRKP